MNYGHRGRDLLLELKRARANDHKSASSSTASVVPPYNDRLVRVAYPDKTTIYTYDAAFNRLTELDETDGEINKSKQ